MHPIHFAKYTFERLITPDNLPKLVHDGALATMVIAIGYWLRQPIKDLFSRIKRHESKTFGAIDFGAKPELSSYVGKVEFANDDAEPQKGEHNQTPDKIEYYKSAHFYWLASDILSALLTAAHSVNQEDTGKNLSQSLRHFKKAGLKDAGIEDRLNWLINLNRSKLKSEWEDEDFRRDLVNEIAIVRDRISRLVETNAGPKFKPFED